MKAQTGIGSVMMTDGVPLRDVERDPSRMAAQAQAILRSDPTIRAAERAISNRLASVAWRLEDGDGTTIGTGEGENAAPELLAIRDLLEKPYTLRKGDPRSTTPRTWMGLASVTSRHMGACGIGFWYMDQAEALAGTPLALLYLNPARITPRYDDAGALVSWMLDKDRPSGGMELEVERVLAFPLEPADAGVFPAGLVETAFGKVETTRLSDRHVQQTLAAGGRLSGVMAPKEGAMPDEAYKQLVRDVRTIGESPDAAKRMLILKAPVDYTQSSASFNDLDLWRLNQMSREDKLALWGVPHSIVGLPTPQGLGGGMSKEYDEAIFWQNAVSPRLRVVREIVQYLLLDRFAALGQSVELVFDEPEFDDETPAYERAARSIDLPLTNRERREIVGQDPFNDARDDEVWVSSTMTRIHPADHMPHAPVPPSGTPPPPTGGTDPMEPGIDAEEKAKVPGIRGLRADQVARVKADVADALRTIGRDIAAKVRKHHDHIARKPADLAAWWDADAVERALSAALSPHIEAIASDTSGLVSKRFVPAKADLVDAILPRLLRSVGLRIRGITDTTRDRVQRLIERGLADGLGAAALGDLIETAGPFDELRAETIARTETARVLNEASLESFREFQVTQVIAVDGDDDETCSARHGQVFSVEEAMTIADHPNGTLSWDPVVDTRALAA